MSKGTASRQMCTEITICAGCFHRAVCGDKDYLSGNKCCNFLDDGRCAMLPCKVGDTVCGSELPSGELCGCPIETVTFWSDGRMLFDAVKGGGRWEIMFDLDDIGKTAFLTRAEAEQYLWGDVSG